MTHDRDEVKADYMDATIAALGGEWGQLHTGHIVRSMAEEIVRLRSILAALREPSEAVLKAVVLHYSGDMKDAISAAVAAAEQEGDS